MSSIIAALSLVFKELLVFVAYVKNNAFPQPLQDTEEEKYLRLMAKGDPYARNKLIEHNLRLVAHIVKKFENTGEDSEDLISIGTIGLIKAIESYQVDKGTKLATYAARCIENEILMSKGVHTLEHFSFCSPTVDGILGVLQFGVVSRRADHKGLLFVPATRNLYPFVQVVHMTPQDLSYLTQAIYGNRA